MYLVYLVQTLHVLFQLRYMWYGVQDTTIEDENLAKIDREIDAEEKKKIGCTPNISDTN